MGIEINSVKKAETLGSEAFFVNANRMQPRSYDLCAGFGAKESQTPCSSQCPWHEGVAYRLVRSATRHHDEVLHHYHRLIKTVCFSFDRYIRGSSVIRVSNDVLLEKAAQNQEKNRAYCDGHDSSFLHQLVTIRLIQSDRLNHGP